MLHVCGVLCRLSLTENLKLLLKTQKSLKCEGICEGNGHSARKYKITGPPLLPIVHLFKESEVPQWLAITITGETDNSETLEIFF